MTEEAAVVSGEVSAGFESVQQLFADRVDEVGDGGAAFAVMLKGRLVVDLWAGRAGDRPWGHDTRGQLSSTSKALYAVAVARLVELGLLDVEAPVARYWPEFATAGKADVTVAHVLSHAAGLPSVPGYEDFTGPNGEILAEDAEIVRLLESAAPEWPPGSGLSYHAVTYVWLIDEIVRRVAGTNVATFFHEEIAEPLKLELGFDKPVNVAPVVLADTWSDDLASYTARVADQALFSRSIFAVDNRNMVAKADARKNNPVAMTWAGTARAVATVFGLLAHGGILDGVKILSSETIEMFAAERQSGQALATGFELRYGLGFQRPVSPPPLGIESPLGGQPHCWGPHDEAFGHEGGGGQMGFADPLSNIGIGFLRSEFSMRSPLGRTVIDATYDCLC